MSREINSGTIRLLYSSPIKIREIVLGKFLAMMLYNLALVLVLLVIVLFALVNIEHADAGPLFSALLGAYLLLCTYASIGLFMSCLTSYQVVAALSTLVVLGMLSYVGTLWQGVDFVRDLTYFLSIAGRIDNMLMGMITSKDILYFLIIIAAFLSFSIFRLRAERESVSWSVKTARYALVVVCALGLGYASSRPGMIAYFDATGNKNLTLTPNGQKLLKEMGNEPLEVTSYINLMDNRFWYGRPENRNQDMARWEQFLRFKPDISFRYVYYYDSIADRNLFKYNPGKTLKELAERYAKSSRADIDIFKTPEEIRKIIDLRPEQNRYVMQLKYKGRST
ncbi:MAG: ABC transporter permease subunit, partial [Bacteroidetes bacterium]|nr:ABC transporter permease subunit [Bacteroidota bacterium]